MPDSAHEPCVVDSSCWHGIADDVAEHEANSGAHPGVPIGADLGELEPRQRRRSHRGPACKLVDQHDLAVVPQQVGGFHVAVRDAFAVQGGEQRAQGLGIARAGLQPAQTQLVRQLRQRCARPRIQPFIQALAHLARRLAGEGDGKDLAGLRAREQRPHDARDQHPGLARAGAGLHGHAAPRVAGHGVERLARDGAAVVLVGSRAAHWTALRPADCGIRLGAALRLMACGGRSRQGPCGRRRARPVVSAWWRPGGRFPRAPRGWPGAG